MDAVMHEGDVIPPTVYDKISRKEVPNEEFIRRHAVNANNFLSQEQLERSHPKLARRMLKSEGPELAHGVGDADREAERVMSTV